MPGWPTCKMPCRTARSPADPPRLLATNSPAGTAPFRTASPCGAPAVHLPPPRLGSLPALPPVDRSAGAAPGVLGAPHDGLEPPQQGPGLVRVSGAEHPIRPLLSSHLV